MNKWIAEFELEDGDTMPEHMDLEYKGVRIDFHCKPQNQDPCSTCGYEEGSIYCKEHCPHEAKIEQKTCDDAVSRQWLMKCVNEGWIEFDTEEDENRFIHLVRDIAPSVTIESKIVALLEKTYDDFRKCKGGEGWLKIDGKEYFTDVGYAIDGMRIFVEVFKQRLAQNRPFEIVNHYLK